MPKSKPRKPPRLKSPKLRKPEGEPVGHVALDQAVLLNWYDHHQRDLPWRKSCHPWHILLSEILLQQTQVSRGIEYWHRMIEAFPTIESMAVAEVDHVLKAWEGAGYYSRARRLHTLAQQVMLPLSEGGHNGVLPQTAEDLLKLPGIGPYTAAAVASIAFSQPIACVDGNIRRVMARQSAQPAPTVNQTQQWADDCLEPLRPGDWNQALMELGATVCKPRQPSCEVCPIHESCSGKSTPHSYPLPNKTKTKSVTYRCEVRLDETGQPVLYQRPPSGLFGGLWGFELFESFDDPSDHMLGYVGQVKHTLSHRKMTINVWIGRAEGSVQGHHPKELALSGLDHKILELLHSKDCFVSP